jgi:protease I
MVMAQTGKTAVMLIAQNGFQDDEFFRPKEVLEKNGVTVTVASSALTEAKGMNGGSFKPQVLLSTVKADNFDAVIFIGGSGAVQYLDDAQAQKLAQDAVAQGKIVGAICIAPRILANAGVLKGKKATVYPTEGEKLKAAGVEYTAKPVEIDGKIITADGPGSAVQFGEELVKALQ